jgi:predicted ester cyclase
MEQNQRNKQLVWDFWHLLDHTSAAEAAQAMQPVMHPDARWHGPDPIGPMQGAEQFVAEFWSSLRHSFNGLRRESRLFFGGRSKGRVDGENDGREWVCGTGYLRGRFDQEWLGIPATQAPVQIRWGEFCRVEDGLIAEIYFLLDLVDLMQQAGFQVLPPSRGRDGLYPPPRDDNGVLLGPQSAEASQRTLELIRHFIFDGLNRYDRSELGSMGVAEFFHPDVRWYGPGGIGACNGLKEFEELHQRHWLHAFPDRAVQDLDSLFSEGSYTGASGWAGVKGSHGGEYLGVPASGKRIEVNGLDYWRRSGDRFIENWVLVDMVHLFRQMGVDLFARMRQQQEARS